MDPSVDGVDMISSIPNDILHHILSLIRTQYAIRTSVLSRGWRHVWCHTPFLDFDCFHRYGIRRKLTAQDISQTLSLYRSPKITSCHLPMTRNFREHEMNSWIEFVVSRNVEKLSLVFEDGYPNHVFKKIFYLSSSLTQLCISHCDMNPGCTVVSWKSLRKLELGNCNLYDETVANILSGSPVLETLRLEYCTGPQRLDLSKSRSLRRLEIFWCRGPTEIVAPHIHYLSLNNSCEAPEPLPSILVDVSSLAEADISLNRRYLLKKDGFLQTMVLKMLAKLQNVKRLTFTGTILQILSLAELHGVLFPTLKVQTLTLKTTFTRYVIPGLARLLHNSPELQNLIADVRFVGIQDSWLDEYMDSEGLSTDGSWRSKYEVFPTSLEFCRMMRCKDEIWKLMASFMEMVIRNVKTLETLEVGLEYVVSDARWFEDLLQMLPTLSNNNNVSIVFKR